jgi:hypothetical protein
MKFSTYILLLLFFALIYSCSDDTCNEDTSTLLKMELTVVDTNLTNINFLENLSLYSPEWPDSIHYSEEGSDETLSLMLSPNSDTSEIIISSANAALKDTLTIISQRELVFFSAECGFVTNYFIDAFLYSVNYIDSIDITSYQISTNKDGQVQIYF